MEKKKRGNNEGSIIKRRDGRWMARVTLEHGKRKHIYGKTRQEVSRRMVETQQEIEQGLPILDERQTVGQYLETWVEVAKSQIRGSSWRRYSDFVRVHLVPGLGKIPLAKLTPQQVQLFYARKLAEGLSSTTVYHIHGMFHRALKDAFQMGLVQRNVTEMLRSPRRSTKEMMPLTEEQAAHFLEIVKGDRFEALYALAVTTGMREGELLGVRWQDLDLDNMTLYVRMNVQESENRFILAETKTAYSRRNIKLSKLVIAALQLHAVRQAEERERLGKAWDASAGLVFPNTLGGIMIPDNLVKRSFKRLVEKAGFPPELRFHDLRHTAATILLSRGVNVKVVSEMLGHADIAITLRIYAHVIPNMQQVAADVMDSLFVVNVKEETKENSE
jgi:integrase